MRRVLLTVVRGHVPLGVESEDLARLGTFLYDEVYLPDKRKTKDGILPYIRLLVHP